MTNSSVPLKTIGLILEALALPILIIVAVLLNIPDKDLGAIGVLLAFGGCMFFTGLILCHLPQETEKEQRKMSDEKSTAKKVLTIVFCSALGSVALSLLCFFICVRRFVRW
jgi:cobalamin synthase